MKIADLDILLQEGEGVMLEYKESVSSSFARELVGFANTPIFSPNPEVRAQAGAKEGPSTAQVGSKKGPNQAHDEAHDGSEPAVLVPHMYGTSTAHVALLKAAMEPQTRDALQLVAAIRHRQHFYLEYLRPLLEAGLLERTIPDKPRSPRQRYHTTVAGRTVLANAEKETPA